MDHNSLDAELSRNLAGMLTAGTSKCGKAVLGGLKSSSFRQSSNRTGHGFIRNVDKPVGYFDWRHGAAGVGVYLNGKLLKLLLNNLGVQREILVGTKNCREVLRN